MDSIINYTYDITIHDELTKENLYENIVNYIESDQKYEYFKDRIITKYLCKSNIDEIEEIITFIKNEYNIAEDLGLYKNGSSLAKAQIIFYLCKMALL